VSERPALRSAVESTVPERPNVGNWATPPRIGEGLADQIRDCLADLPWYVITPFLRHWHRTWGATPAEAAAPMPGDHLLPRAQYVCTRAINIDVPPAEVWPWLVQVGYRRAGWYAGDLLDTFARPSVRRIVPELQDLRVGQWLSMVPKPSERSAFLVDSFAEPSWLLWRTPNRSWAWRLVPLPGGGLGCGRTASDFSVASVVHVSIHAHTCREDGTIRSVRLRPGLECERALSPTCACAVGARFGR
jgi:hypothetical protein